MNGYIKKISTTYFFMSVRYWLIKKLAGKDMIAINLRVIRNPYDAITICDGTKSLIVNVHCESSGIAPNNENHNDLKDKWIAEENQQ